MTVGRGSPEPSCEVGTLGTGRSCDAQHRWPALGLGARSPSCQPTIRMPDLLGFKPWSGGAIMGVWCTIEAARVAFAHTGRDRVGSIQRTTRRRLGHRERIRSFVSRYDDRGGRWLCGLVENALPRCPVDELDVGCQSPALVLRWRPCSRRSLSMVHHSAARRLRNDACRFRR